MNPSNASLTALGTSLMRAVHSRIDPVPLFDDEWGERLVPDSFRVALRERALASMEPDARAKALRSSNAAFDYGLRANAAYPDNIVRARYTEDALKAAVARGVSQYVIIGAGFDSFSCRRPAYADQLNIYEVDHPATQGLKRQRLMDCGVPSSEYLHFISADLSVEELGDALARSPFQPSELTFFSWLGVTMYLTRDSNLRTLRAIASCAAPGSELVFTYVDETVFTSAYVGTASFHALKAQVAAIGEPFLSGFDPGTLEEQLLGTGLQLLDDLNGDQAVARYDEKGANQFKSAAEAHIARASIVGTSGPNAAA
ncbi:MAG: class I SAM-dependent methyltransferase [Burkholderiales bacterium]